MRSTAFLLNVKAVFRPITNIPRVRERSVVKLSVTPSAVLGEAGIALDRAAHCGDHAAKLDHPAVPNALDDALVVPGNGRDN